MGILSTGVDYYMVYRFIKALVTPFNKTKAFDLGIVDDEGNILKKRRELKTAEEKKAYGYFERMVWNIKKLVHKIPIVGKKFGNYAAAAYLILKEDNSLEDYKQTTFLKFAWDGLETLVENAPVSNTVGIAGLPPDAPPVSKKAQKKICKRNKKKKKKKDYEVVSFNEFIGGQL
jgi:hypothetical protein